MKVATLLEVPERIDPRADVICYTENFCRDEVGKSIQCLHIEAIAQVSVERFRDEDQIGRIRMLNRRRS